MIDKSFLRAGHMPTLAASFFYVDMSFMVWVMLGSLGVQISDDLNLDAVPLLAGALLRVVNGVLVDLIGPKSTGLIGQLIVIGGLVSACYVEITSFGEIIAFGVYSASPEPRLAWPCRWLRGGIPPNIRGSRLASQARETPARCSPRSLFLALQRRLAGRTCSDWRPLKKLNG